MQIENFNNCIQLMTKHATSLSIVGLLQSQKANSKPKHTKPKKKLEKSNELVTTYEAHPFV